MLPEVSRVRALAAPGPVRGIRLSRAEMLAQVREHVAKEIPKQAIRSEGLEAQLLGLVPTKLDYEEAEYSLMDAQLAGYYEPADKTMYLAEDVRGAAARATLAHELVHALQDTRWSLRDRTKYRPGATDVSSAASALAEGDATSAMFDMEMLQEGVDATAEQVPDDLYVEKILTNIAEGPGAGLPQYMRRGLAYPYLYGLLFVNALRRRGGWDEVDHAWDTPPTTTEHILHVAKYDAHEEAAAVDAPTFAALGDGWAVTDADTFGELELRLDLEQWIAPPEARRAATGWGGDRAVLIQRGEEVAFAWHVRFDAGRAAPDEEATEAFYAFARALTGATRKPPATTTDFACAERADRGPLAAARGGRDLVVLAGPARVASASWTTSGDCRLAMRWSSEVLSGSP
jgi:hypothetical protein